ncbi:MAG: pitrilysin family protein [Bdellovibrionota bacterium]
MIQFKKTVLPNGIRVVSELHPSSRAVSLGVWLLTGTRDEAAEMAGISHFLEHLVFKGTKNRSAYQIAKSLEALGGDLNAFTSRENTCYHALVLRDHWPVAMDVLSDLVSHMRIDRKNFKLEKGVILQEIAMCEESPEEMIFDIFADRVYGKHSLGRPILGNIKSIANMTQTQVVNYYRQHYTGQNMIVSAAGNIDHQDLVEMVHKKLGHKKKLKLSSKRTAPRWNKIRHIVEKNSEQVHILFGLPAASFNDPYRFEALIINSLLGGGMTSRLYQSVRERKGLVYSIYSLLNTYVDVGQINIYAAADPEKVQEVVEIIFNELKKLKNSGVRRSDVELFKTQVVGNILLGSDDIENRMNSLCVNEMIFGKYRSVESVVDEIKKVTVDSVHEYLEEKFRLNALSGVLLGPGLSSIADWWKDVEV